MRAVIAVAIEQNFRCHYCDHQMSRYQHIEYESLPRDALTQDHVVTRYLGGLTTKENLVAACNQCNYIRGELDAEAFANVLNKWFQRNLTLWFHWHKISQHEVLDRKAHCAGIHEKMLRGKARRHQELAYAHQAFSQRFHKLLRRAA